MSTAGLDSAAAEFERVRSRLFGLAYRMLGSVAEAEDVVQDAWLRWQQADRAAVQNPAAFLTTVTTRLAINELESARHRREQYAGPWLPEPVDTSADPTLGAENAEALDSAVLVLLERLRPAERAAYVLREAFDYPYDAIATVLDTSAGNARQLVSRARTHVRSGRPAHGGTVDRAQQRSLLDAFLTAARGGDLGRLEAVLAENAVSTTDGGGVAARAARRPVAGRNRVARFVAGFPDSFWAGAEPRWLETNGQPSILLRTADGPLALLSVTASADGIEDLFWVMAPDKLARLDTGPAGP